MMATRNNGRYADTRPLVKEMNQLIEEIQELAPEISISELQRNSNLPNRDLLNIRSGNITNINRIREANRFLKSTKEFLLKVEKEGNNDESSENLEWLKQVEELKEEYGLAYEEISLLLGASYASVSGWKSSRGTPPKKYLDKLNDIYKEREVLDLANLKELEMKETAQKIIFIKEKTGWTNQELADKTGVERSTMSRYTKGYSTPRARTQKKIDEVYNSLKEKEKRKNSTKNNRASEQIAKIKKLTNLNETQIAKKIGVTQAAVNSWSTGRYIPNEENENKIKELINRIEQSKETEVSETKAPTKKYTFIERIKILFRGEC